MAQGAGGGSVAAQAPAHPVTAPPLLSSGAPPRKKVTSKKPKRKKVTPAVSSPSQKAPPKPHKSPRNALNVEDAMDSLVGKEQPWWVAKNGLAKWIVFNLLTVVSMTTASHYYQTQTAKSISMEITAGKGIKVGTTSASPFDLFIAWAMAININVKRQKEVIKIALMFSSFSEMKSVYAATILEDNSFQASLDPDSCVNVLMCILESPPGLKRKLRQRAQDLQAKVLKIPKEVSQLDKSLGEITVVMKKRALALREQYEAKKKELDAIRLLVDAENKLQEPIKDLMATYYAKKAGALSRQDREKVTVHWNQNRNQEQETYSLDQYLTIISRRIGAAAAARYVPTVKSAEAYKLGLELRVFASPGCEGEDADRSEEMEDVEVSNEHEADLNAALTGS